MRGGTVWLSRAMVLVVIVGKSDGRSDCDSFAPKQLQWTEHVNTGDGGCTILMVQLKITCYVTNGVV